MIIQDSSVFGLAFTFSLLYKAQMCILLSQIFLGVWQQAVSASCESLAYLERSHLKFLLPLSSFLFVALLKYVAKPLCAKLPFSSIQSLFESHANTALLPYSCNGQ